MNYRSRCDRGAADIEDAALKGRLYTEASAKREEKRNIKERRKERKGKRKRKERV